MKTLFVVVTDRHTWGKGETLSQALKNASCLPHHKFYFDVYEGLEGADVEMGDVMVSSFDGSRSWSKDVVKCIFSTRETESIESMCSKGNWTEHVVSFISKLLPDTKGSMRRKRLYDAMCETLDYLEGSHELSEELLTIE